MRIAKRLTVACLVSVALAASTLTAVAEDVPSPVPDAQASLSPSPSAEPSAAPSESAAPSAPPSTSASPSEAPEPAEPTQVLTTATPSEQASTPASSRVEAVAVEPTLTVKADTTKPVGTYGYASGTISPAAPADVVVQAYYSGAWRDVNSVTADADGTFRLRLLYGLNTVGKQKFRVRAAHDGFTMTSDVIVFTRTAKITVTSYAKTKVIHFASYVKGSIKGASSSTVKLQYYNGTKWVNVDSGKADSSGKFTIELYKKVTKGTHKYRLRIDSALGWVYSDTFTQKRIAGWKSSITNTKASEVKYTYQTGCPVGTSQLSTITMTYWDYDGDIRTGTMIVRRDVATKVRAAFKAAFFKGFNVNRMSNPDVWKADDVTMMAANNTSAFNCRKVTGNPYRVSPHSYGRSVDVNTYENPYRVNGKWYPSSKYGTYRPKVQGLLHSNSTLVKELKKRGFDWYSGWDWQHFQG